MNLVYGLVCHESLVAQWLQNSSGLRKVMGCITADPSSTQDTCHIQRSIWPGSPRVSRSSVVRAPDRCVEGHRFDLCQGSTIYSQLSTVIYKAGCWDCNDFTSVKQNDNLMIGKLSTSRPSLKMITRQPLLTMSKPPDTTSSGIILKF